MDTSILQRNHLLSLLKPEVQQRVLPLLHLVPIPIGQFLSQADRQISTVYFPLSFCFYTLRRHSRKSFRMQRVTAHIALNSVVLDGS
jgi:hypothetical protein